MLDFNKYYEILLKANSPTTIFVGGRIYSYSDTIPTFSKQTCPASFNGNLDIKPTIFIKQETIQESSQTGVYVFYVAVWGWRLNNTINEEIIKTFLLNVNSNGIFGTRLMNAVQNGYDTQFNCVSSLLRFRIEYKWQELLLFP